MANNRAWLVFVFNGSVWRRMQQCGCKRCINVQGPVNLEGNHGYLGMELKGRVKKMRELDYGKIGMRIRQVRKAKGWSQDELAKKCGISMSFLGHIERGSRVMSMETFAAICGALDAGADELLWGEAGLSRAVLAMWGQPDAPVHADLGGVAAGAARRKPEAARKDSYSMYIQIMKSVAEIMSETP